MAREPAHGLRWKLATVVDILVVVAIGAALIAFLILMFASSSTASRS